MDKNQMKEIMNDAAETAIKDYLQDKTKENLAKVVNFLRPAYLLVPAMLHEEDKKPFPLFLRNKDGVSYLAAFTSKERVLEEMQDKYVMVMPFPMCNGIVANDTFQLAGLVINPGSDNLILKRELVASLYEEDKEIVKRIQLQKQKAQQVKFAGDVRGMVEFGILPQKVYTEGEEFIQLLCKEKESLVNKIFEEAHTNGKINPYDESDFAVMALDISSSMTLIRIDLPGKKSKGVFCNRIYITFNPVTKTAGYYTIEKVPNKNGQRLGMMLEGGMHKDLGEAPVEGAEMQQIIQLAQSLEETE